MTTLEPEVVKIQLTPTQKAAALCPSRIVWIVGPTGEGKTHTGVASLFAHAKRCGRPIRGLLIRDTHENIKANLVPSIEKGYPGLFTWRDDCHWLDGPDLTMRCIGANDLRDLAKMQGPEFDLIWMEEPAPIIEAANVGIQEDVFLFALTRLRGTGDTPKRMQITMNPSDEEHWTYRHRYGGVVDGVRMDPLPDTKVFNIPRGENFHLSSLDRQMAEAAFAHRPDLYARYVEGRDHKLYPGKAVTPEYDPAIHLSKEPLDPVPGVKGFRFWDGGLNPSVCIGQIMPSGRIVVLDSMVLQNQGLEQLIRTKVIPLLNQRYAKVTEWFDSGDASLENREQSNSEHRASAKIAELLDGTFVPGAQEWDDRREALKEALCRKGFFLVNRQVTAGERINWVHAGLSGGYAYKVNSLGQVLRDGPDKTIYSHPCDALGHGLARLFSPIKQARPKLVDRSRSIGRAASYAVS